MPSTAPLAEKDANAPVGAEQQLTDNKVKDVKSMEYHRQMLADKMAQEKYVSPSDNIMSPCTAKLTALRSKQMGRVKPKSLFAQTSAKKMENGPLFASKAGAAPKENES